MIKFLRAGVAAGLMMLGSLAAAGTAQAQWLRAETDGFIVYGDVSERQIRDYARRMSRFDALLRTYYPIPADYETPKLEIYLANGGRDLQRAWPDVPSTVGGWYTPNAPRIHAVANVDSSLADDVLYHEYGHHFLFQLKADAYPAWFIEGLAEYYATVRDRGDSIEIGRHNPGRMLSFVQQGANSWAPLEDVLKWRVSPSGRFRGADYYAIAWALTHYMISDPERRTALSRYLAAVSGGADSVAAMEEATGRTAAQLQDDVRRYLSGPIVTFTPQITLPDPEIAIERLAPDHAALIWFDLRLDQQPPTLDVGEITFPRRDRETEAAHARRLEEARQEAVETRAALIRDSLAEAARWPDSRFGILVAARAQRLDGRLDEAFATLAPLLTEDARDADATRLAGEILTQQARALEDPEAMASGLRRARAYLAEAMQLDPLDQRVYLALDDSRRGAPGYPTANDISTLEVAGILAPQSSEVRMRLARLYIATGAAPAAVTILGPVANAPHASSQRAAARALLAEARAAAGLAADPELAAPGVGETEESEGA
jgi:hypothetical protein